MSNLYEVQGDAPIALTPTLRKLVESGELSHSQAVKIMQEQGTAPRVLLEG